MLKYQEEINEVGNCPADDFRSENRPAYHFVFEDETEADQNFVPRIKKTPSSSTRKNLSKNNMLCKSYSLSMFRSRDEAINRRYRLIELYGDKMRSLGDSLAFTELSPEDGIMDNPSGDGHYSFFPYEEADLEQKFDIVETLCTI